MNYYKRTNTNKLLKIWYSMKSRCYNVDCKDYKYYGKKGITVCKEWLIYDEFANWALANGYEDGLSIDRINPSINYRPDNCEWVTPSENSRRRAITSPTHNSPSIETRLKLSKSSRESHIKDPTLKDRQKHWRSENGNTKISEDELTILTEIKQSGGGWKTGYEYINNKVNVRYFRYCIWNLLK